MTVSSDKFVITLFSGGGKLLFRRLYKGLKRKKEIYLAFVDKNNRSYN